MKALLATSAFAAALAFSTASQAAPIVPAGIAPQADVTLVAEGCGRGWHRGPYGGCRRNVTPNWPCYYVRGPYGGWRLICR